MTTTRTNDTHRRGPCPDPPEILEGDAVRAVARSVLAAVRNTSRVRPAVYLAGKIGFKDWRHDVVRGLGRGDEAPWRTRPAAVLSGLADYAGPFFVSCDHGCYHGPGAHGVLGSAEVGLCQEQPHDRLAGRPFVMAECLAAIDRADVVFGWVDCTDCYGTLFELGYAKALGKRVVVARPPDRPDLDELWFTFTACAPEVVIARSPIAALCSALVPVAMRAASAR